METTPESNNSDKLAKQDEQQPVQYRDPTPLEVFLMSPEIHAFISKIPDLFQANIEAKSRTTRGATKNVLLWSAVLVLIIIAPVATLTWFDKFSSDAAAFLFGAIVGAAFTFIRSFLAGRD